MLDLLAPGWVGSLIGLAGLAAAVVTYFLTRQRSLLAYRYAGERLLGLSGDGLPPDITVQYRGQAIPRLTRTLVVFWNAGEKTIPGEDVVSSDPLRVKIEDDGSVLAVTVLKVSREACQFQVTSSPATPQHVDLAFAYLDAGDGAVIEILHTSESRVADFLGTVRGLPQGLRSFGRIAALGRMRRSFPLPGSPRGLGVAVTLVGAVAVGAAVFVPWEAVRTSSTDVPVRWVVAAAGGLYFLLGVALVLLTRRRYPKGLHVEELE